ncbi:MAG: hypothetical protein JXX29_03735 [Deltaproteobacteria bacterium]|nr:hypothetical protein [Deltaproteobacteria bacterium]MBN2670754.1 hypothetical protein [Deltaproteobacteria bacterium]
MKMGAWVVAENKSDIVKFIKNGTLLEGYSKEDTSRILMAVSSLKFDQVVKTIDPERGASEYKLEGYLPYFKPRAAVSNSVLPNNTVILSQHSR